MSTDKNGHIEDDQPTQVIDIDALRLSKERAAGLYDLELEKNDAKDSMSTIDSPSTSKYTTATVRISAIVFVILVLLFVCLMEYLSVSGTNLYINVTKSTSLRFHCFFQAISVCIQMLITMSRTTAILD